MTGLCQGAVAAKRSQVVDLSQQESFFGSLPGLLDMKKDYDFQDASRGGVIPHTDKTAITLMIDTAILDAARKQADVSGIGCQTLINDLVRKSLGLQ
ncbi:Uncharacterised protein [Paucimonas lemoignei]|nr:Uncharacterised protein [Paucimonas lemoignei]